MEALALAAGIAIENAHLHQRVQEIAVYDDRDRLARDLHDTVIQRLFAVGLSLQSIAGAAAAEGLASRLNAAISDLDDTIRQVRSTIYELGLTGVEEGLRARIQSLANELTPVVGFKIRVRSSTGPWTRRYRTRSPSTCCPRSARGSPISVATRTQLRPASNCASQTPCAVSRSQTTVVASISLLQGDTGSD